MTWNGGLLTVYDFLDAVSFFSRTFSKRTLNQWFCLVVSWLVESILGIPQLEQDLNPGKGLA